MGVNYITLCHSYDNDICHSSTHTEDATQGLTQFGREVVKEMNRLGIMIDISHASEGTFWDVIKYSTQPIIASHSSSRTLCDHDRNLTDEQLRALAKMAEWRSYVSSIPISIKPQKPHPFVMQSNI